MPRVERDEFEQTDHPIGEIADGHAAGPQKGRGAGINPGNRFESIRLHILGEERDRVREEEEPTQRVVTQIHADSTRSVINHVDSPDLSFSWTLNPYRGCEHGCVYCYARPGHEFLGMSCGLDFETKIMAKHDAPSLFRKHLGSRGWKGEPIVMSGVTDPYQPVERELGITRACLVVAAECRQPISIITKNRLVTRDIDVLRKLNEHRACRVSISLTTLDNELASKMEPRASSPQARLDAMRELSDAGIPVTVMTAPMIPGLNDHELPALLQAAAKAGANNAGYVLLRLPHQIKALFLEWLARHVPGQAAKVESLLRQTREGDLYESSWGVRHRGRGPVAARIRSCFDVFSKRNALNTRWESLNSGSFVPPNLRRDGQGTLFSQA